MTGGDALLHYVRANKELVGEILSSPSDLEVIKYYLGKTPALPNHPLSLFQLAIKEYVGEVRLLDELANSEEQVENSREKDSKISMMHSAVAEILALGHIYKTFFETSQFLSSRDDSDSSFPQVIYQWPKNPDEQELEMNYGDLQERLKKIKENTNVKGTEIIEEKNTKGRWLSQIQFRSIPMFELFKQFLLGKKKN